MHTLFGVELPAKTLFFCLHRLRNLTSFSLLAFHVLVGFLLSFNIAARTLSESLVLAFRQTLELMAVRFRLLECPPHYFSF